MSKALCFIPALGCFGPLFMIMGEKIRIMSMLGAFMTSIGVLLLFVQVIKQQTLIEELRSNAAKQVS